MEDMRLKVLVYGWYNNTNIGDILFCQAFKSLFPEIEFTFVNFITQELISIHDYIFFGGGSFLYSQINTNVANILDELKKKNIFYIGVGAETNIHIMHQQIMYNCRLIATRTPNGAHKLKKFTKTEILEIPDLVYGLSNLASIVPKNDILPKSILVLPNAEILPKWNDIQWKHASFNYFKSEFSQTLDSLKNSKHKISFIPLCTNTNMNDIGVSIEIINQMQNRNFDEQFYDVSNDFTRLTHLISKHEIIITQRYHGAILAHICKRPCIVLAHHDKLKNPTNSSITLPYYGVNKQILHDSILTCKNMNILPIKLNKLEEMCARVCKLL